MSRIIDPDTARGDFNARLKMGWAKHHLRLMDEELNAFLGREPKPYSVTTEDDFEAGEYVIRFDLEAAPLNLSLIAGDFVACLRGSLDHLASALTNCSGGTPNDRASFPIIGVNNSEGRKSFGLALRGVPAAAIQVIESLQPYHTGQAYVSTKLWALHRLWNIDKHRRIPLYPSGINLKLTHPAEMPPLANGADNSGVVRFPLSTKPYIDLEPTMEISIKFGDASEGIIVDYRGLLDIHNFVRNHLMPRFECFF